MRYTKKQRMLIDRILTESKKQEETEKQLKQLVKEILNRHNQRSQTIKLNGDTIDEILKKYPQQNVSWDWKIQQILKQIKEGVYTDTKEKRDDE